MTYNSIYTGAQVDDAVENMQAILQRTVTVYVDDYDGNIASAVNALPAAGGIVQFGAGDYTSPYQGTYFGQPTIMTKAHVTFKGAGKPTFNNTYSKLEGGTVIKGSFFFAADGVEFRDLGIDAGKDYCDAAYAGSPREGLIGIDRENAGVTGFAGGDPSKQGFVAENISILCHRTGKAGDTSDVHALLLENYIGWNIRNIDHVMGGAGLVIKSSHGTMDGAYCRGSFKYAVLNKSEDYSAASYNTFSNIVIENLTTPDPTISDLTTYDTNGFVIEAASAAAEHITVTNVIANGVVNGLQFFSPGANVVKQCTVSNFHARKCYGYGALFGNGVVDQCSVVNSRVILSTRGIYVTIATATNISVVGCVVDGCTQYNYSNTAGTMQIVSCLSYNSGFGHFGNSGGTTNFVGGFGVDNLTKIGGLTGGTVSGLAPYFSTTPSGQPAFLIGPLFGAMAATDYTSLGIRVRNSGGGGVASGDSVGVEFRAFQTGTGTNTAGLDVMTRTSSTVLTRAARFDQNGAPILRANPTPPALDELRTITFYWVDNATLGVQMRGADGVTRSGTIAVS